MFLAQRAIVLCRNRVITVLGRIVVPVICSFGAVAFSPTPMADASEKQHVSKPSALPAEISAVCDKLQPLLHGKKCLIAPIIGASQGQAGKLECEYIVQCVLRDELLKRGETLVSDSPLWEKMEAGANSRMPHVTPLIIKKMAQLCSAEVVVTGKCQIGAKSSISLTLNGANDGKGIETHEFQLTLADLRHELLPPALNLKVADYALRQIGKKVDRGECTDLIIRALEAGGGDSFGGIHNMTYVWGKLLAPGAALMPGDIAQLENAVLADGWQFLHHTVVVRRVIDGTKVEILHQNWAGGGEAGRIVRCDTHDLAVKSGQIRMYRPMLATRASSPSR
jgi:hypothetical protein